MTKFLTTLLLTATIAAPAFAQQVAAPAGPGAPPAENAAIAHHDRVVAHRAARHGHYRKAAAATHAANAAAMDSTVPH